MKSVVIVSILSLASVSGAQVTARSQNPEAALYTSACITKLNSEIRASDAFKNLNLKYLQFLDGYKITGADTVDMRFSLFDKLDDSPIGQIGTAHVSIANGQCTLLSAEKLSN